MKFILILLLVIAGLPVLAEDAPTAGVPQQSAQATISSSSTVIPAGWNVENQILTSTQCDWIKVPVQRVAQKRALTSYDFAQIECYRAHWAKKGLSVTPSVRNGLELMLQMDIIHTPIFLARTPQEIDLAYQIITQLLTRVDWYVNVPAPAPCKPPFTGGMRTAEIEPWCLEPIGLDRPTVAVQKPLPTKEQQAVIIKRLCFEKSGLTPDRMPFWQKGPVMEWRLGALWMTRCPVEGGTTNGCGHWDGPGPIPDPPVPY